MPCFESRRIDVMNRKSTPKGETGERKKSSVYNVYTYIYYVYIYIHVYNFSYTHVVIKRETDYGGVGWKTLAVRTCSGGGWAGRARGPTMEQGCQPTTVAWQTAAAAAAVTMVVDTRTR